MLSDVEKGRSLMFARLTPVSTLIDTKHQSATTNFSTQRFRDICEIGVMHEQRVIPKPKEQLLGKSCQENQIYLHLTKPKIVIGFSVAITKTGRQSNL